MDKINGFKISNVTMSGFSSFKAEQSYDMDDLTYISGGNHVGKTSIANAIEVAVTETTFQGEAKMLDKLYNEDVLEIEVKLQIKDNAGKNHELVRKRKNDRRAITFDSYSVRQSDLPCVCFRRSCRFGVGGLKWIRLLEGDREVCIIGIIKNAEINKPYYIRDIMIITGEV